ncbi:LysR family transcriptional regulator [Collinsella vaginalis]|uniref:LysR family transcriptional regulator n=1 Tax=Collinsella vaginalis TaxID=1870987 RepID=UPI00117CA68C|nr:LysR family transcriptional regulator [Collinsella vaginalis]
MDIRKLEAFLTVVATGKIIDAAEKLFISQSSLSKQMSQLERELDTKLFKKTRNGVELTQAGFDFYTYASRAVSDYRTATARLQMYREEDKYPLIVGSLPLTDEYGLSDSFSSFWARNPSVQIEYIERSQENLEDKLRRHRIDLALLRLDLIGSEFLTAPIVTDELIVICSGRNPLSIERTIDLKSLRNEQFIMLEEKSDVTQIFRRACEAEGFFPNTPLHHSRHRMLLKAVRNNMGVTVLPRRLLASAPTGDLIGIPFKHPLRSTLGLAWLAEKPITAVERTFIDFVIEDSRAHGLRADGPPSS